MNLKMRGGLQDLSLGDRGNHGGAPHVSDAHAHFSYPDYWSRNTTFIHLFRKTPKEALTV